MNVLTSIVFLSLIYGSFCCKCKAPEAKKSYESSSFMIKALVKSKIVITTGTADDGDTSAAKSRDVRFALTVQKTYKDSANDTVKAAIKSGQVSTSAQSASCGVQLVVGKVYIISGQLGNETLSAHSCGFNKEVDKLTEDEKKFFKGLDKKE